MTGMAEIDIAVAKKAEKRMRADASPMNSVGVTMPSVKPLTALQVARGDQRMRGIGREERGDAEAQVALLKSPAIQRANSSVIKTITNRIAPR